MAAAGARIRLSRGIDSRAIVELSVAALLWAIAPQSAAGPCPSDAVISFPRDAPWRCDIAFEAGSAYLLRVGQNAADLTVELTDPTGQPVMKVDSPTRRAGPELMLMTAQQSGKHEIAVRASDRGPRDFETDFALMEWRNEGESGVLQGLDLVTRAAATEDANGVAALARQFGQLEQAAELFSALGETELEAEARLRIAALQYWLVNDWEQAAAAAQAAAASFTAIDDVMGQASADTIRGAALIETTHASSSASRRRGVHGRPSPFEEAEALLRSSAETFGRRGMAYFQAEAINHLGAAYFYQAQPEKARSQWTRAAQLLEEAGEDSVLPLQNLAVLDYDRGDYDQAIEAYERVLARLDVRSDVSTRIAVLNNLGVARYVTGRTDIALDLHLQALQLGASPVDRSRTLHNLGVLYLALGDEERARVFLEQALTLRRSPVAGDPRGLLTSLLFVGELYRERGDHAQALELHLEALERAGSLTERGRTLLAVAEDHVAAGGIEPALAVADAARALDLPQGWPLLRSIASTHAYSRLRAGDAEGEAALLAAAQANADAGDADLAARDFHRLGFEAYRNGSFDTALAYTMRAIDIYEGQRLFALNPDLRGTYLALRAATYDLQTEILMTQADRSPDTDERLRWVERAVNAAERRRARALAELASIGVDTNKSNAFAAAEVMQFDRQIAAKRHRLASIQEQQNPSAEKIDDLQHELQVLRARLDVAVGRMSSDAGAASKPARPIVLASLRDHLTTDSVVLTYLSGHDHLWLLGLTREASRVIALGPRSEVEDGARELQALWSQPSPIPDANRELEVSRRILGSSLELLDDKAQVVVVADGTLRRLSFAALRTQSPGQDVRSSRLVDSHVVSYRATLSQFDTGTLRPIDPASKRRILLVGAPDFLQVRPESRGPFPEAGPEFPPLPGARHELDAIAKTASEWQVDLLSGEHATKANLLQQPMNSYRVIHFATHARLDVQDPQLSAIALTSVSHGKAIEDPMFSLREVLGLDLSADAVVLSTCDSSLGKTYGAQTSIGLSEAFLLAGAEHVLGSLWRVPDAATSAYMRALYSEYLGHHRTLQDAVFEASRAMMVNPRYRHPYFWAAFVMLSR